MNLIRAWVQNGVVINFIVIRDEQVQEFETESIKLINYGSLDVREGDTWDGEQYYRDGEPLTANE